MGEIISEHIRQAAEMTRELERQIREAIPPGHHIEDADMQNAIVDLLGAMDSLRDAMTHFLLPPTRPTTAPPPATSIAQQAASTKCFCPNCNYPITVSLS